MDRWRSARRGRSREDGVTDGMSASWGELTGGRVRSAWRRKRVGALRRACCEFTLLQCNGIVRDNRWLLRKRGSRALTLPF